MRTPLLTLLLLAAAMLLSNVATGENIARGVNVVVIDAGHGGNYPGAHYGNLYEKDLVLKVALKLGAMIEKGMPGVKVVYTRTTDKMLGKKLVDDLQRRADIANEAGGELFVSIHANAAQTTSARGVEMLIMGETPKEQRYNTDAIYENNRDELIDLATEPNAPIIRARIQNMQVTYGEYSLAAARYFEESFRKAGRVVRKTKKQLVRVLYASDMPSVLAEIGFMSNREEFAYMRSEKGQNEIARCLYNGIRNYSDFMLRIRQGDDGAPVTPPAEAAAEPEVEPQKGQTTPPASAATEQEGQEPLRYTVQVLSTDRRLKSGSRELKGYANEARELRGTDGLYKYCIGDYPTRQAAQQQAAKIRKKFPGAFVVCFRGTKIVKK